MKRVDSWYPMSEHWQSLTQGGWLVLSHWGREGWAAAWHDITALTFDPEFGRRRQPVVTVSRGDDTATFPCHEVAAARLHHWWRESQNQRTAVPRWTDVDSLLAEPGHHGGRHWMSRLVLAVGPSEAYALGGRDVAAAHGSLRRLGFEATAPELRDLLDSLPTNPNSSWQFYEGVATYIFDWRRGARASRVIGTLNIERFRSDVGAPMAPSGGTAQTG